MADGFQRLIEILRTTYPEIRGVAERDWGSDREEYRTRIRVSVRNQLVVDQASESDAIPESLSLTDLNKIPRSTRWSVSISHARTRGGWLAISLPARIGFDIEDPARIKSELVRRMSTAVEIETCPDPAFLWCAKEAYFKSLAQDQPQAITQLNIGDWREAAPGVFTFSAKPHKMGRGWIVRGEDLLFGACIV